MVVTNDQVLYERASHMKDQGLAFDREYRHDIVGYNYRMTNICAAIGAAQMENVEDVVKRKILLAERYRKYLKDVPVELPPIVKDTFNTYWMFSILLSDAKDRAPLRKKLLDNGIETRPMFYPCHLMPMYAQKYRKLKVSEDIGLRGINLPSWPGLTEENIRFICSLIAEYYQESSPAR